MLLTSLSGFIIALFFTIVKSFLKLFLNGHAVGAGAPNEEHGVTFGFCSPDGFY
jgi:hypothetical protein